MGVILPFVYVGLGQHAGWCQPLWHEPGTQNIAVFSMPLGTLISNIAGCLLIGLIAGIGASSQPALHGDATVAGHGFLWWFYYHVVFRL